MKLTQLETCERCDGTGKVEPNQDPLWKPRLITDPECPSCMGRGLVAGDMLPGVPDRGLLVAGYS